MPNTLLYEQKVRSASFRISFTLILGVVIFLACELGRLLGNQGQALQISVLWPAAGISLAAILLYGFHCWQGILLGNFAYNFLHLFIDSTSYINPLLAAIAISLGSLTQALLGGFIIRTLSSPGYFNTVKDIFIFLIPAGILTCMTASSIGVISLYAYGDLHPETLLITWITFWLGDSLGVYIFTPLLVVWITYTPSVKLKEYPLEACLMFFSFIVLSLLSIFYNYPLFHLFLPLSLWITFRFRIFGATLAIFCIASTAIISTSLGYGIYAALLTNPLIVLVSFLEAIIGTSLILAGVINEREEAWDVLQNYTKHLEEKIRSKRQEEPEQESTQRRKDAKTQRGEEGR